MTGKTQVMSLRLPAALMAQLRKLARLEHRTTADYLRLKLHAIAKSESLAATGGQS